MENIITIIADNIRNTTFENNAYIAGGYVRDKVLGKQSDDIDIVVSLPNGGIALAQHLYKHGVCSKPLIFERFGTAQVIISGYKIEFVMARKEYYKTENRKPNVQYSSITEDVFRRDFTINSLIMNVMDNKIIDITKFGIKDIKAKLIRATSEPDIIFNEDPLRILRAVRFAVQLQFNLEDKTLQGMIKNASMLNNISKERIRDELIKILLSPAPDAGIRLMTDHGIMKYVIPEVAKLKGEQQNRYHHKDVLGHTLDVISNTPADIDLRLAALLHDISKPQTKTIDEKGIHFYRHEAASAKRAIKILQNLKFSNKITSKVSRLIKNHMRLKSFGNDLQNLTNVAIRRLISQMQEDLEPLLKLIHADNISHASRYNLPEQIPNLRLRIAANLKKINGKKLPVTGKDIMLHFGLSEGENIGKVLKKAQEIWLAHPQWNKTEILNTIKLEEE